MRSRASLDLRANRARLLSELGQIDEAKRQYLEILKTRSDAFRDARELCRPAPADRVFRRRRGSLTPQPSRITPAIREDIPILPTLLMAEKQLETARAHYETALRIDPAHVNAHRGLAAIFWELGDEERARHHLARQYRNVPIATFSLFGNGRANPAFGAHVGPVEATSRGMI